MTCRTDATVTNLGTSRSLRLLFSLLAALCCSLSAHVGNAQQARELARAGAPAWVLLVLVDPLTDADLVERTASWFDSSTFVLSSRKVTVTPRDVLAAKTEGGMTIWMTQPQAEEVRLYFVIGSGQARRYLVRSVPQPRGLDEVERERLAQVTYSSALGLWQGSVGTAAPEILEQLAPAPAARSPRAPPRAALQADSDSSRLPSARQTRVEPSLGVWYAVTTSRQEGTAHGPGVVARLQVVTTRLALGGALRAQQRFPQHASARGFRLELLTTALRAAAEAEIRLGAPLQLVTALAGGVDLVRFEAQRPENSLWSPEPRQLSARPVLAPEAGLHWHAAPVNLRLIADLTVLVLREHFDVSLDGARSELLSPARLQPGLRAELSWP